MIQYKKTAVCRIICSFVLAILCGIFTHQAVTSLPAVAGQPPGISARAFTLAASTAFTLTGTVSDVMAIPVDNVQVFAFSGAASFETTTNAAGQYTLSLATGPFYDLIFNPPIGSHLASQSHRGISGTQSINVTLPPGHAISGVVYSDATKSNPIGRTAIFAFNTDSFDGFGLPPGDPDGSYQLSLEEGTWELTFTPPHYQGLGPTRTERISLTTDINKDIILQPGFTISGTVSDGIQSISDAEIFAQDPGQEAGYGFSETDINGRYTGTVPSGNFDILFLAPPFHGLGSAVITDVSGPPDVHLDVTLPPGHTLSGTVRCGNGLSNVFVSAAPKPPVSAGSLGSWGRFAGTNGFYALALQPGVYTITVSPPENSPLPVRVLSTVNITQDITLDIDYCIFLPIINS